MSGAPLRPAPCIVVAGSLHYDIMVDAPDRPRAGETVTGLGWSPKFGGKGGNQAVAAARAGADVRFVGAVGKDEFAPLMLGALRDAGIATDRVARLAEHGTGMSVAILDASGDYGAVIVSGANLAIDPRTLADPDLWAGADLLILQNEIPEPVNLAAIAQARAQGVRVCLNAAPARAFSSGLMAGVDILVVNAIEAEDLGAGAVTDLASATGAADHLARQVPVAIVTAGGAGVAWAGTQGRGSRSAAVLEVVSTHGAGDMFIGTLTHALGTGAPLEAAIDAASRAAETHISTPHAKI